MLASTPWTRDDCESPDIWSHSPWRWHNSPTRGTKDLRSRTALSVSGSRKTGIVQELRKVGSKTATNTDVYGVTSTSIFVAEVVEPIARKIPVVQCHRPP